MKRLADDGWSVVRTKGDHRQYKHSDKPGRRVTFAGHSNDDIPPGTWSSIRKQAGWDEETTT